VKGLVGFDLAKGDRPSNQTRCGVGGGGFVGSFADWLFCP
jgi:hypothetical protein